MTREAEGMSEIELDEKALAAACDAIAETAGMDRDGIDEGVARAAIHAYLHAAPSPAQAGNLADANPTRSKMEPVQDMPGVDEIGRVIDPDAIDAGGYDGRVPLTPDMLRRRGIACYKATAIIALFQPAFAALAQEVRYSRQLADAYRRQAEDAQRSLASAREEEPGTHFANLLGREWIGPDGRRYSPTRERSHDDIAF